MRVLLIKTSSMGDVIHTLPALTDAAKAIRNVTFDWIVEDSFAEIPMWHPAVNEVIPISLRRWRKGVFSKKTRQEWRIFRQKLRSQEYDLVLDAQGLVKSAFLTLFTRGKRSGLDFRSAREGLASFFYQRKHTVNFYQHAVVRVRSLFSQALGYREPNTPPNFALDRAQFIQHSEGDYLVFLHGTTWDTKLWPEHYWIKLAKFAGRAGLRVKISGGNDAEVARAYRIADYCNNVDVLPRLTIAKMATLLAGAKAVVAVDTGFGHLAAALNIPTISLYGPTNPDYTGALGDQSTLLSANFVCAPCVAKHCAYKGPQAVYPACFGDLPPEKVWDRLQTSICGPDWPKISSKMLTY